MGVKCENERDGWRWRRWVWCSSPRNGGEGCSVPPPFVRLSWERLTSWLAPPFVCLSWERLTSWRGFHSGHRLRRLDVKSAGCEGGIADMPRHVPTRSSAIHTQTNNVAIPISNCRDVPWHVPLFVIKGWGVEGLRHNFTALTTATTVIVFD